MLLVSPQHKDFGRIGICNPDVEPYVHRQSDPAVLNVDGGSYDRMARRAGEIVRLAQDTDIPSQIKYHACNGFGTLCHDARVLGP